MLIFCALRCGCAQEQFVPALKPISEERSSATVRINYYNNSQYIQINIMPDAELIKESGAELEGMEIGTAYRSGGAFIVEMPEGVTPEALKASGAGFTKAGETELIENPTTVFISWPPDGNSLTKDMAAGLYAKRISQDFTRAKLKKAYLLKARLPDGRFVEALSDKDAVPSGDWFKTLVLNTRLKIGPGRVTTKSFGKIFGGSGPLSDMAARGYMEKADINIAMTWQPPFFSGLPYGAARELLNETRTDLYAFTPYDLPILSPGIQKISTGPIKTPELISSNILLEPSAGGGHVKKYSVKEVNGVKIGFFFVMDDQVLPSRLGPLPAQLADPVETAKEMVKTLLEKEKADVVVMLAWFGEDDLRAILPKIPGVDIVINSMAENSFSVVRTNLVKLENWGDEPDRPAVVAELPKGRIGELQLEFSRQDGKLRLAGISQGSEGLDFAGRNRNKYDDYDDNGFFIGVASGTRLLPDASELWSEGKLQYMPSEIYNLGAMILNDRAESELALFKVNPLSINLAGEIPESVLRLWFQHRKIFTAELDGSALRALIKQIDFSPIPVLDHDQEKYRKGSWLAAGGATKDGRIGGLAINNNESYKVSFTDDLQAEIKYFPALGRLRKKTDTGLYIDDVVAERLSKMKKGIRTEYYGQLRALMSGTSSPRWRWRLNVKDAALQFSQTQVSNTQAFSQVPNSKLQASNQLFTQGTVRLALESRRETLSDDTRVSLDYGKTVLKASGQEKAVNETADQALFENEFRYAVLKWDRFGGAVLGPLVSLGYNTEFTADAGVPKRRIALGKAGVKLFEGRVVRDFYTAAVMERDFTFPEVYTKWAWETGTHLGGLLGGSGPEYSVDISYKRFSPNRLKVTDLKSEFELYAKLKVKIFSDLNLAPFADFYAARGVLTDKTGHNYIFGISLDYSRLFKIRN
jgi:hypothetical protein